MEQEVKKFRVWFLVAITCVAVLLIGCFYFNYISGRINEDSAGHLQEIYGQVNRSFSTFSDRNWDLLTSWSEMLATADAPGEELAALAQNEQARWQFTQFYFLAADQTCKTPDGEERQMDLGDAWGLLLEEDEPVMAGDAASPGQAITVFAVPVQPGEYRGFAYEAIAISYTNAALAESLDIDAFAGEAKCFVIAKDGSVLLSTQSGGSIFSNYLTYLDAVSDISATQMQKLKRDWVNDREGMLHCNIGGEEHYLLYQPVSYQGYVLLSAVPENVVSAGFLQVQRATMAVLIVIFLLISAVGIVIAVLRLRQEARKNRTELAYRDRMFDVLTNNVDDIFLMLDTENFQVEYVSPNVERLLGVPMQEVKQDVRTLARCAVDFDVVIPPEKLAAIPLNGSIKQECEYLHRATGERRWYRMTVYRMSIHGTEKYINILSDRTQEKQMTETLQEALLAAKSANEAKSNFLSNVSHDIRTPMNAIVGFSTLLERDAENPEKVREYTRKITAASHHLLSLINEVLDMSKIESGKTSLNADVFQLPELLEELSIIVLPQAKAKQQNFAIHVQGTPPEQLIGDRLRLNQILLNLLSNAVKYTQDGGDIEFVVSRLPDPTPQIAKLRFVVRDNGIGMSSDYLKYIFNPFSREVSSVTNKVQGTGLGMAITKNLIDLMGGVIQVESELGEGSVFTVDLAFSLPEKKHAEEWYHQKITHILVADDEPEVCETIQEMMADTGVEVVCVNAGQAAVEAAIAAHEAGQGFDVILLDWKMPGVDGVEAARRIRQAVGNDVPILVLTSYDWSDIEEEARRAGIHAFMPKPFFATTFWNTIKPLFMDMPQPAQPAASAASALQGLNLLVVEDNELNSEILTEMLAMEGATCDLAVNGQQAVEMFEQSAAGQYDIILMDVQMPVMNGYDATRRIRSGAHPDAKTIPIVAMTANTFAEDVRQALDAGMNAHLGKPINMNVVRETVARLLNK